MIEIKALNESDVGRWVDYDPPVGKREKGRIKSWNNKFVFVVYKCDDNWGDYQNYTAEATYPNALSFQKKGNQIMAEKDEHKQDENASKKMYISKEGFENVPLRRGFDVIRPLWKILNEVKEETKQDCFVCGGYARFCASPRKKPIEAIDVDVYCETEDAFNALQKALVASGLEVRHENNISLTYEGPEDGVYAYMPPIQLIKPMQEARIVSFGDKKTILENFDFTVIRAAILSPEEVMVDADFMHDEKHTLLRLKNIHCPVSSTLRCMKYSRKGYWLRPFECLKLFIDWTDRPDDYRVKLIEFLRKASENDGLSQEEVDELEAMMRID